MEKKSSDIVIGFASRNPLVINRFNEIVQTEIGRKIQIWDSSKFSLIKWIENIDVLLWDIDSASSNDIDIVIKYLKDKSDIDVIVLSQSATRSAKQTSQVLMAGSRVLLLIPSAEEDRGLWSRFVLDLKREISLIQTQRNLQMIEQLTLKPKKKESIPEITTQPIDLIVIGVSTGGPKALTTIMSSFPHKLGVPILCVQHMPPGFTQSLAEGLNRSSQFTVVEAQDNQVVSPDIFYLAPGGKHLTVIKHQDGNRYNNTLRMRLVDDPPVNNCKPAVDRLFESVSRYYDGRVLAVILTGMGTDGLAGVKALKAKNAYCITQDQISCTVYGMPRAVDQAGLSDEQVSLGEMGQRIQALVRKI